jgi:hypothetical protein
MEKSNGTAFYVTGIILLSYRNYVFYQITERETRKNGSAFGSIADTNLFLLVLPVVPSCFSIYVFEF